jgi:transposase
MNAPDMALGGQDSKVVGSLYVAFELGDRSWKLALVEVYCQQRTLFS